MHRTQATSQCAGAISETNKQKKPHKDPLI